MMPRAAFLACLSLTAVIAGCTSEPEQQSSDAISTSDGEREPTPTPAPPAGNGTSVATPATPASASPAASGTATTVTSPTAAPPSPSPAATATPRAQLTLEGEPVSYTWDIFGPEMSVIGKVRSTGREAASGDVTATFYAADGRVVGTRSDSVGPLPPGEAWAFRLPTVGSLSVPTSDVASFKVRVTSQTSFFDPAPPGTLDVTGDSLSTTSGSYRPGRAVVSGEVTNTGSESVTFAEVSAAVYDAQGNLVEVIDGFTQPTTIPPGGTAAFSLEGDRTGVGFARYEIYVQGWT